MSEPIKEINNPMSKNDALRIMVRQVKDRGPVNADFIHVCQLAERFLDRLDADALNQREAANKIAESARSDALEEAAKLCENSSIVHRTFEETEAALDMAKQCASAIRRELKP